MPLTTIAGKDRILQEATHLFIEQGYHRLSMRTLADAAGISKAGIYHHFKDKESLFLSVLMYHLDALSLIVARASLAEGTVRKRISMMVTDILSCPVEQRAIIQVVRQELDQLSINAQQEVMRAYQHTFIGQITDLLTEGIENNEFRAVDPVILTWALLGIIYPYLSPRRENDTAPPIEILLSIFFDGAAVSSQ